jgi:Trk K+ transport system NAD-binding subunit
MRLALRTSSPAAGGRLGSLPLPQSAVIVGVERRAELIVPNADTVVQAGDVVIALAQREAREPIRALFLGDVRI